jgi:hypothetical protein
MTPAEPTDPPPAAATSSAAYARFVDSLPMNFDRWHDGIGIDLDAVGELSDLEVQAAYTLLRGRPQTPREIEALARLATRGPPALPDLSAELERTAADAYQSADDRLAALSALNDLGHAPDFDRRLAAQIRRLRKVEGGLTRALLLAESHPSETVKQALLWATWNQTECAPHCAALICYLTGVTGEPFDFARRDLFLRFDVQTSYFDRKAAFDELCGLVGMEFQPDQD